MPSLEDLRQNYPIAINWRELSVFSGVTCVNGVEIHLAGLSSCNGNGEMVTGSAGSLFEAPLARAYFELLERMAIVAMGEHRAPAWIARDANFVVRRALGADVIMPTSSDVCRRYARSNGVAVGQSWQEACSKAGWELVERDRVLRSWYGQSRPVPVTLPGSAVPEALQSLYSFAAYRFEGLGDSDVHVAGVFGFPTSDTSPLLYGFGARDAEHAALSAATTECLQRLGFLWGEPLPQGEPTFSPTPDFHQELFLWPSMHERVRMWLNGEHQDFSRWITSSGKPRDQEPLFVDITPPELSRRLFIAKAIPDGEIPLVFGRNHPDVGCALPEGLQIHPIA
jgi:hypothetical protein